MTEHIKVMSIRQILSALSTCVSERKDLDVLGIFQELLSKMLLATILMLYDVYLLPFLL